MGVSRTIRFPTGTVPTWDAVRSELARFGDTVPLRMIDGLPAFPDETPEPGWKELRVGFPPGMVTLRVGGADTLECIVWGNADALLLAARDTLAWAAASAGGGVVLTDTGELSPAAFAASHGLSPS